ncbi:hypothetical protein L5515_018511 [Caenorhabditis briggsae]|uniref:Uncharacterized protein n=1 Tax=Caenorhabditis briggsae TaxID=6238 RepID=A0AAE9JSZ7_CAEBR|nr:hypothetical protein L5515_018511 [Caenorhabditis briggsae]
MDLPPPIPQAIDWSTVFGTPTNFPDTQIINNRIEANRYYFIRTVVAGIGALRNWTESLYSTLRSLILEKSHCVTRISSSCGILQWRSKSLKPS